MTSADDSRFGPKYMNVLLNGADNNRTTLRYDARGPRTSACILECTHLQCTPDLPALSMKGIPWLVRILSRDVGFAAAFDANGFSTQLGFSTFVGAMHDHESLFSPPDIYSFNDLCILLSEFLMRFSDLVQLLDVPAPQAIVDFNDPAPGIRDGMIALGRTGGGNLYFQGNAEFWRTFVIELHPWLAQVTGLERLVGVTGGPVPDTSAASLIAGGNWTAHLNAPALSVFSAKNVLRNFDSRVSFFLRSELPITQTVHQTGNTTRIDTVAFEFNLVEDDESTISVSQTRLTGTQSFSEVSQARIVKDINSSFNYLRDQAINSVETRLMARVRPWNPTLFKFDDEKNVNAMSHSHDFISIDYKISQAL